MKKFKNITVKEISLLICDDCGEQAEPSDYSFHEFISITHRCGYASIHGDGNLYNIDLCQQCFVGMCGDSLTIIELTDDVCTNSNVVCLEAILAANTIMNKEELNIALKRVEHLWDAQYHSAEGNELHQLADLICAYEGKSWDSYFNEVDAVSYDFMAEREIIIEKKGVASDIMSDVKVNKDVDDESLRTGIDE